MPERLIVATANAGKLREIRSLLVPDLSQTAAELETVEKNAMSHRGKALRALIELLRAEL